MAAREAEIREIFRLQGDYCAQLDSPFTSRVCRLLSGRLDPSGAVGSAVFGWPGDAATAADNVPLRLCGALNHLALTGGDGELAALYPPRSDPAGLDDDTLWRAVDGAMARHGPAVIAFLAHAPQTNEVRRSVALIPAYHAIAARFGLPLSIRELGASAGLNLNAWQYGLEAGGVHLGPHDAMLTLKPEWRGEEPLPASVTVASATGCDLSPIDLSREGEAQRLLCYIWPDQLQRVALIRAAIEIARQTGTVPERADAIDWLERQLAAHRPGEALVIQHTVAWQYFPAEAKARGEKLLADHGARASRAAPIARLSMENDGGEPGACLHLTLWPGDVGSDGERHDLGRVDFHGRWIDWRNPRFSAT